jgi:group I intron endonuclease
MKNTNTNKIDPVVTYNDASAEMKSILSDNSFPCSDDYQNRTRETWPGGPRGKSGVYLWTNKINVKMYIGSSISLSRRLSHYFSISFLQTAQTKRKSGKSIINSALLKYGYSNFSFSVLEYCDPARVIEREQYYLDLLKPEYNILKIAGSSVGYKHTEEAIQKISLKGKGRIFSEEAREKLSLSGLRRREEIRFVVGRANGHPVLVTDTETGETTEYYAMVEAARKLQVGEKTIKRYIGKEKLLKGKYLIKKG